MKICTDLCAVYYLSVHYVGPALLGYTWRALYIVCIQAMECMPVCVYRLWSVCQCMQCMPWWIYETYTL